MKKSIYFKDFVDEFKSCGRGNHFSYWGLHAIFDYFEDLEEDTGHEIELDVVAICCEYTEYEDIEELKETYPDIEDIDDLYEHTTVIEFLNEGKDGIIIADF